MASSAELDITVCLSRWRPSFFEIHHDHEVNIIYGGFGGMCTRCIRRSHWSLNSARVHRPVKVPHSGFVRTLASLLCFAEDCLERIPLWGSIGSWGLPSFLSGFTLRPCLGRSIYTVCYSTT
ncbi:hypothetical protein BO79DRAFT_271775 [Aspergillus costaricaensis CBS 115574]|uniref:Uncharacterized protein n=1 Tax=Aspergillus costaricaensis CBS 115574 TaxID=1448317 RepID=A0ACD1I613_9EURO|nr:hypothetical protein BO79DRAFT_271775 [Aspergillus costaricaensis CBS 115574]RAK85999.1 hypothetical protein BO79DRAFT_271775 [Aspergillus costaricaensis CBS 115574]